MLGLLVVRFLVTLYGVGVIILLCMGTLANTRKRRNIGYMKFLVFPLMLFRKKDRTKLVNEIFGRK